MSNPRDPKDPTAKSSEFNLFATDAFDFKNYFKTKTKFRYDSMEIDAFRQQFENMRSDEVEDMVMPLLNTLYRFSLMTESDTQAQRAQDQHVHIKLTEEINHLLAAYAKAEIEQTKIPTPVNKEVITDALQYTQEFIKNTLASLSSNHDPLYSICQEKTSRIAEQTIQNRP